MKRTPGTLEMAKLYEIQGYTAEALEIYQSLAEHDKRPEIQEAVLRLQVGETLPVSEHAAPQTQSRPAAEKKIAVLMEEWIRLMALEQRLAHFRKIKERLC